MFQRNKVNETKDDTANKTNKRNRQSTYSYNQKPKTIFFFVIFLLILVNILFIYHLRRKKETAINLIFNDFALLLTNPNQQEEGSYGWYRNQLELEHKLGNVQFSDRIMTRFGFKDTSTTSDDMFYYFRTFKPREKCKRQGSCEIYASQKAETIIGEGIDLDAILHHYKYEDPLSVEPFYNSNIRKFHSIIEKHYWVPFTNLTNVMKKSNSVDLIYGEKMWRGMRRLNLFMNSEAIVDEYIQPHIQFPNNSHSMMNFSSSTADISICFQRSCSIWVNYLYYPIEFTKNRAVFGKKPLTPRKGICAFISNCLQGDIAKKRLSILNKLSEFLPVWQYGKCGNNTKEGKGGKQFELENNCRFYFSVENSIVEDYVTEKFFQGLKAIENGAKLIILYKGAPNFNSFGFPKNLVINIDDYENIEELGAYLKELNENDDKFVKHFSKMSKSEKKEIDLAVKNMDYRLGKNIPCRICKIIGEMKLARYLLFKIGLKPSNNKLNQQEWTKFKARYNFLGEERLKILDDIYSMAYSIFYKKDNYKNEFNLGWTFE